MTDNRLHYNPAQLRCLLQYPNRLVGIMGRGTGKSTGILAPRMVKCAINMPGSNNGLLAKSFKQIQTRTFPAIESGWRKLGLKEWDEKTGGHYTIGKRNDSFPMPEKKPSDWKHTVHFFTGAIFSFSSQDRKGDSNGLDLQSIHADEAKQIDAEDLNDSIIPTLRGMTQYKHLVEYRMLTYTTDMPTTPDGKWLLDLESQCDPDIVNLIFQLQIELQDRVKTLYTKKHSPSYHTQLEKIINRLRRQLVMLQQRHTYFAEASSFDNIDMLTPEYIETQRRNLPDFVFDTAILNKRPIGLEHGQRFYPQLSKKNFYIDFDYAYLDTLPPILPDEMNTSKADRDCQHSQPLEVVIDWGAKINSMLVCQEDYENRRFNVLKEFFALQPEIIPDLIEKFCKYYIHHSDADKIVYMYYDRNGNAHMANSKETYAEYAQRVFLEHGWNAILMSFNENPGHRDKFEFMNLGLTNKERRLPKIMINEENCPSLKIAMYNAPLKISEGEIKKDKKSEQSKTIPQEQATHITDCLDVIYYSKYRKNIEESTGGYFGLSVA
jgi:hypothetical protein